MSRDSRVFAALRAALCAACAGAAWPAWGALELVPALTVSYRDFEYATGETRVEGDLMSWGVGLTGILGQVYFDLSGERNLSPGQETGGRPSNAGVEFSRQDTALSLGYLVSESISVFAGYKYGKTTITRPGTLSLRELTTSLKGRGPYIGAGGGVPVKDWGFLSFSAAYASLDATFQDQAANTASGTASGTSLGIEWKGPLTKNLYYELGMIHHRYYYEQFDKLDFDITETILSYKAALSYRF